jgi:NADPH-dependent curcumin reductase CurA
MRGHPFTMNMPDGKVLDSRDILTPMSVVSYMRTNMKDPAQYVFPQALGSLVLAGTIM